MAVIQLVQEDITITIQDGDYGRSCGLTYKSSGAYDVRVSITCENLEDLRSFILMNETPNTPVQLRVTELIDRIERMHKEWKPSAQSIDF